MISRGAVSEPELAPEIVNNIDDAQSTADSAQSTADAAAAAATTAQSTADGKNRIFYLTSAPTNPQSGYALVTGDLWFDTDDTHKLYRWTGSAWAQAVVSGTNITAGTIDASTVNVSNINAGSITAGIISSIEMRAGTPVGGVYPFRVTTGGSMTASSGSIGGWEIDANGLMSPNGNIYLYNDSTTASINCGTGVGSQLNISDDGSLSAEYSSGGQTNYLVINNPDNAWNLIATSTESTSRTKVGYSGVAVDRTSGSADFSLLLSNSLSVNAATGNITVNAGQQRTVDLQREYVASGQFINCYNKTNSTVVGVVRFSSTTSADFFPSSDRRLKENDTPVQDALGSIKLLQPVEYNFIGDNSKLHGFIAQDLYEVYPQVVSVGGEDPRNDPWGVNYSGLTPLLAAGVKELIARVEQLEDQVRSIKNT